MGSSWEARKWKGHDEGVGRVEGRVVDSWRPGPSKGPANYFSAAIQMRSLPCAPHGRGGQSRVIWRMSGTCREPGAAPVLAAGRRNGSTLQQLPSVWKLSSRPRTKRGISLRTMYQLARHSLSFPEMHSIFRCITLSRGNSLFYSVSKIDIGRSNFWFLSIVQTSRGPHKEPQSLNSSLHNRAQCISRFRGALKVGNSKLEPRRGLPKTRHQNWTRWTLFSGLPKHTFCPVYKLGDQPRHPRNHSLKLKRQTWDGWPKFCLPAVRWAASHHSSLTEPTSPGV